MQPSIGRIVVYTAIQYEFNGKQPEQVPAIIRRVNDDGTVDLQIFEDAYQRKTSVQFGTEQGQCNWPARV